jgi:hypothetical protein
LAGWEGGVEGDAQAEGARGKAVRRDGKAVLEVTRWHSLRDTCNRADGVAEKKERVRIA